jgi:hypothetical protein
MTPKTHRQPVQSAISLPPMEKKIGGTTYIITARFNPNAHEGILSKLYRWMWNDIDS